MTSIITDEMVQKALNYERPGDQQLSRSTVKAILELIAPDIIEALAISLRKACDEMMNSLPEGLREDRRWLSVADGVDEAITHIRALKVRP